MFKKIEPLSKDTHQDLRFAPTHSYDFAASVLNAPLSATEFSTAARYYPIIFPSEGTAPLVIFALNQNKNLYINDDGSWKVSYVPAHIRRYPFILANSGKEEEKKEADKGKKKGKGKGKKKEKEKEKETKKEKNSFVVCIDPQAPHFSAGQGDPMFTADGAPADMTQKAINFLTKFHEELQVTQTICQELEEQGVLVVKQISSKVDGKASVLGKFRCVDTKKLNELDDAVLAKWVRNGLMGLINAHLQSLANLKELA